MCAPVLTEARGISYPRRVSRDIREVIATLAWYNRRANEAFAAILDGHEELVLRPGTTWYGSVLALLGHIAISDVEWLKRTWVDRLRQGEPLSLQYRSYADDVFGSLGAWREFRRSLDTDIESFCHALTDEELGATVRYGRGTAGSQITRYEQPRWQLLLHMFNHQTHHRGAVAQVLDEHGIENNASNLVHYLREAGPRGEANAE